jgi:hypothetical protein
LLFTCSEYKTMSAALHLYTQGKTTTAYTISPLPQIATVGNSIKFTSAIYEPTSSSYTSSPKSGILGNTFNYLTNQNVNFNILGVSKKGAANVIEFDADTDSNPILSGPIDDGFGVILAADFIPAGRDTSNAAPPVISPYMPPVPVITPLPTTAVSYIKPGQIVNAPNVSDSTSNTPVIRDIPITHNQSTQSSLLQSNKLLFLIIIILVVVLGFMYQRMKTMSVSKMGGGSMGGAIGGVVSGAQFLGTTILGGIGYAIGGTVGAFGVKKISGGSNESEQSLPEGIKGGSRSNENRSNNSILESKRVRFGGNKFISTNNNLISVF